MIKIQAVQLSPPIATKIVNLHPEELFRSECLIGRSPNCHLVLDDPAVCGIHAKIFCQQQQYYFVDLASGLGSLINDDVVQINQSYLLKMGDLLRLGDSALLIEGLATPTLVAEIPRSPTSNAWIDNLPVRCVEVIDETPDVKTFWFVAEPAVAFVFQPGQFVTLKLEIDGKSIVRPYSISSSPTQSDRFAITVKRVSAGLVSNWLHDYVTIGSALQVNRPIGKFTCTTSPTRKLLLLSAGSGITPMMSMARWICAIQADDDVVFFHAARRHEDIIFHQELQQLVDGAPNLHVAIALTQPEPDWDGLTGRLTAEMLSAMAPDLLADRTVYVCGADPFRATARTLLESLGFPMERYFEESFGGAAPTVNRPIASPPPAFGVSAILQSLAPESPTIDDLIDVQAGVLPVAAPDYPTIANRVLFIHSHKEILSAADETILELAERSDVPITSGCRSGNCGVCKQLMLEGDVIYQADPTALSEADVLSGFILPCIAHAKERVVLNV
jgi:glycine betaine catabolism B